MTFKEFMEDPVNMLYALNEKELKKIAENISSYNMQRLRDFAEEAMDMPLQSVTYKKAMKLVRDKHDYESFSIYAWPNPNTENGFPYIKRDGFPNPEHLKGDKLALRKMAFSVYYLVLLYYLTKESRYYKRMREHIFCFFINEETKMNPNLNYGQAMPGINKGQRGGIIDFMVTFGYALSLLQCLRSEKMLDEELTLGLKQWLSDFMQWLLTSPFGKEMSVCENNHALVYDYLILVLSLFLDDFYHLTWIRQRYSDRINQQILENGLMPAEMKRANSRSYFFMNLKLFIEIGKLLNLDMNRYPLLKSALQYYLRHNHVELWRYLQNKIFPEEYDNYMIYLAKSYFSINSERLRVASSLQYILFADMYEEYYETR